MSNDTVQMDWVEAAKILPQHAHIPIRQVYIWLFSSGLEIALVSKDGHSWQFPGGKPNPGEAPVQAGVREVLEETGLDISGAARSLEFFGYYLVTKIENGFQYQFLQVRYLLLLEQAAGQLVLHAGYEDREQSVADQVRYAQWASLEEAKRLILWLKSSAELTSVLKGLPNK